MCVDVPVAANVYEGLIQSEIGLRSQYADFRHQTTEEPVVNKGTCIVFLDRTGAENSDPY